MQRQQSMDMPPSDLDTSMLSTTNALAAPDQTGQQSRELTGGPNFNYAYPAPMPRKSSTEKGFGSWADSRHQQDLASLDDYLRMYDENQKPGNSGNARKDHTGERIVDLNGNGPRLNIHAAATTAPIADRDFMLDKLNAGVNE